MAPAPNDVSWSTLALVIGMAAGVSAGAIWLGAVAKQVDVNTDRLSKIETLMDEIRRHDADTTARETINEKRLDRLESK